MSFLLSAVLLLAAQNSQAALKGNACGVLKDEFVAPDCRLTICNQERLAGSLFLEAGKTKVSIRAGSSRAVREASELMGQLVCVHGDYEGEGAAEMLVFTSISRAMSEAISEE